MVMHYESDISLNDIFGMKNGIPTNIYQMCLFKIKNT